ncbi:MAG TPA: hypothetical protein VIP98_00895 [Microlunatus sp.]
MKNTTSNITSGGIARMTQMYNTAMVRSTGRFDIRHQAVMTPRMRPKIVVRMVSSMVCSRPCMITWLNRYDPITCQCQLSLKTNSRTSTRNK